MKLYVFIFAFVMGVILTVFGYQAFTIYQLRSTVADDHATLSQVVNFLNAQIQASQAGASQSSNRQPTSQIVNPTPASGTSVKK